MAPVGIIILSLPSRPLLLNQRTRPLSTMLFQHNSTLRSRILRITRSFRNVTTRFTRLLKTAPIGLITAAPIQLRKRRTLQRLTGWLNTSPYFRNITVLLR